MITSPRGFTLLIAVVLASVALSIGMVLLDIALKQVILSSAARQSQTAFYNADTAMECALYWDQEHDAFFYGGAIAEINCNTQDIEVAINDTANPRTRTFSVPCETSGTAGEVIITKTVNDVTAIYATGYNTCNVSDDRRIERGLKVTY
jgi:hypothetical protein